MTMARPALDSNNHAMVRTALKAVYALQVQTMGQRQRRAYKAPATLYCASCGAPVQVRRRPQLGQDVYCRDKSTCKWRAWAAARRQEGQPVRSAQPQTAGQMPGAPIRAGSESPGQSPEQVPDMAQLWLAVHRL